MTRRKKSRKPGPLAPSKKPKEPTTIGGIVKGKKKGKGQKPGQRHNLAKPQTSERVDHGGQQDPRKGSRRKIPLVAVNAPPKVEHGLSAADELRQLEQDAHLQLLVEKFEQGDSLSDDEQRYLDLKSERYEQLAVQLGIDLDDEDEWDDEEY